MDGGFFGFAMGFASFSTIIPLFFANLTDSAVLIGLIPAIHNVGWQLPQLLNARKVSSMERYKPYVVFMTINERLPYLGFVFLALFLSKISISTALVVAFLLLIWQGLGAGFTANAWQNLIGKIIPPGRHATFFGFQSGIANLFAGATAVMAGVILERFPFPQNFGYCFLIASILMIISWIFINSTREPLHSVEKAAGPQRSLWSNVGTILRENHGFRWFLISRIIFQFATMATAFYTVFAVKHLGMGEATAGLMTSILFITQVVANILLGWIADRRGKLTVMRIGAGAAVVSALLAFFAPSANWFFVVMFFTGIANTVFWTIGIAVTLEFGDESTRPTYIGMANTLISPAAILSPLLGGWLADTWGYQVTFATSVVFAIIALLVITFLVKLPGNKHAF